MSLRTDNTLDILRNHRIEQQRRLQGHEPLISQDVYFYSFVYNSSSRGLSYDKGNLELSVFLHTVPEEGWLNVQWFSPNNNEAASDAIWIEQCDAGLSQTFALPQIPSKGDWRVVVSFGDRLLRQFSLSVN